MANKKTFTNNGKVITFAQGNLQLNTSTPAFREKLQLLADGINKMNDTRLMYNARIKRLMADIEFAEYQRDTLCTKEEQREKYDARIETYEAEIAECRAAVDAISTEIKERTPEVTDADKNLYYAYRTYVEGEEVAASGNTYARAWAEWLDEAGVVPTDKGIKYLMSQIGVKKASAKQMYKNGGEVFTTAISQAQFIDLAYRTIATMMYKSKLLKNFEYNFKEEKKSK